MKRILNMARWIVRAIVLGVCVGWAMWLLTSLVLKATILRQHHAWLVLLLPLGALAIHALYQWLGPYLKTGTALVIQMINDGISGAAHAEDTKHISPKLAPLILVATFLSHLTGASTGKEGSGVQIGCSIGNYLSHVEDLLLPKRWETHDATTSGVWLICGAGAAFGALFNAPVAGMLFGLQFSAPGVNRTDAFIPCVVATFTSCLFSHRIMHTVTLAPPEAALVSPSPLLLVQLALLALLMGLVCQAFLFLAKAWKGWLGRRFSHKAQEELCSSLLALALSLACWPLLGGFSCNGLSADLIGAQAPWYTLPIKMALTILSMGAGFVGGEVVPTMVLGSLSASLLAPLFSGIPFSALAMFGACGMLSAATKLPFVCAMLSLELFGWANPALSFYVCIIAFACGGKGGIYPMQQRTIALEERMLH